MATQKKSGLGRGLGELFQRTDPDTMPPAPDTDVSRETSDQAETEATPGKKAPATATPAKATSTRSGSSGKAASSPKSTTKGESTQISEEIAEDVKPPVQTSDSAEASSMGEKEPEVTPLRTVSDGRTSTAMPSEASFAELPVAEISPNAQQPRQVFDEDDLDELAGSIAEVGVLQPIIVRPRDEGGYELVMGERRWRAAQQAGLDAIPAIIRPTEQHDMLRDALLENLHRVQLNPLEEAAAYQQLLTEFECTHEELSTRIKRSRPQIANTIRLLKLPPTVQRRVAAGVLSAGHARALLGLTDVLQQEQLAQRIVAEGLSVRATEELVTLSGTGPSSRTPRQPRERSPRAIELSQVLSDHLETRARVDIGRKKGKITIEFSTQDDLDRILAIINPGD